MSERAARGPRVEVVRGARAGFVLPLAGDIVTVGRGVDCNLRLDPEGDVAASARHAAFLRRGASWVVRDLDSRNGTFVNDLPVAGETPLRSGDRVTLGAGGPVLLFHGPAAAPAVEAPSPEAPATRTMTAPAVSPARHSHVQLVLAAVLGAVVLGAAAFLYVDRRDQRAWERERARVQLRLDSLRLESERTQAQLHGQVAGLAQALQASRVQVEELRQELVRTGPGRHAASGTIARRLAATSSALREQQAAATLDFRTIEQANRRATAILYVELENGTVVEGTAFAVQPDGLLLTNRHVVLDPAGGRRPRRLALQFCDSEQIFPARLVATADTLDLAAVRVEKLEGSVPVVRGFNLRPDTLAPGAPVALIGYPLGGDERLAGTAGRIVRPIVGAGTLRRLRADRLELVGYGAEGASGSPVFDAAGEVVGVLFGGRQETAGQTLYAVPATGAARLLDVLRRLGSS